MNGSRTSTPAGPPGINLSRRIKGTTPQNRFEATIAGPSDWDPATSRGSPARTPQLTKPNSRPVPQCAGEAAPAPRQQGPLEGDPLSAVEAAAPENTRRRSRLGRGVSHEQPSGRRPRAQSTPGRSASGAGPGHQPFFSGGEKGFRARCREINGSAAADSHYGISPPPATRPAQLSAVESQPSEINDSRHRQVWRRHPQRRHPGSGCSSDRSGRAFSVGEKTGGQRSMRRRGPGPGAASAPLRARSTGPDSSARIVCHQIRAIGLQPRVHAVHQMLSRDKGSLAAQICCGALVVEQLLPHYSRKQRLHRAQPQLSRVAVADKVDQGGRIVLLQAGPHRAISTGRRSGVAKRLPTRSLQLDGVARIAAACRRIPPAPGHQVGSQVGTVPPTAKRAAGGFRQDNISPGTA